MKQDRGEAVILAFAAAMSSAGDKKEKKPNPDKTAKSRVRGNNFTETD